MAEPDLRSWPCFRKQEGAEPRDIGDTPPTGMDLRPKKRDIIRDRTASSPPNYVSGLNSANMFAKSVQRFFFEVGTVPIFQPRVRSLLELQPEYMRKMIKTVWHATPAGNWRSELPPGVKTQVRRTGEGTRQEVTARDLSANLRNWQFINDYLATDFGEEVEKSPWLGYPGAKRCLPGITTFTNVFASFIHLVIYEYLSGRLPTLEDCFGHPPGVHIEDDYEWMTPRKLLRKEELLNNYPGPQYYRYLPSFKIEVMFDLFVLVLKRRRGYNRELDLLQFIQLYHGGGPSWTVERISTTALGNMFEACFNLSAGECMAISKSACGVWGSFQFRFHMKDGWREDHCAPLLFKDFSKKRKDLQPIDLEELKLSGMVTCFGLAPSPEPGSAYEKFDFIVYGDQLTALNQETLGVVKLDSALFQARKMTEDRLKEQLRELDLGEGSKSSGTNRHPYEVIPYGHDFPYCTRDPKAIGNFEGVRFPASPHINNRYLGQLKKKGLVKGQPVKGEPVRGRPVKEEPVKGAPIKSDSGRERWISDRGNEWVSGGSDWSSDWWSSDWSSGWSSGWGSYEYPPDKEEEERLRRLRGDSPICPSLLRREARARARGSDC